jgi:hypothetical protein
LTSVKVPTGDAACAALAAAVEVIFVGTIFAKHPHATTQGCSYANSFNN